MAYGRCGSPETYINILLLGETGIGELKVLIPSTFIVTDSETFDETKVLVGIPNDNENYENDRHSSTQLCRSYIFPIGNRSIRFIDGPGVGDTRGKTTRLLKVLLKELHESNDVEVPFNRENTFITYSESWNKSVEKFSRLIIRILQYDLHAVQEMKSLNEAQLLIHKLSRPVAEIATLIQENILLAKQYKEKLFNNSTNQVSKKISQKTGRFVRLRERLFVLMKNVLKLLMFMSCIRMYWSSIIQRRRALRKTGSRTNDFKDNTAALDLISSSMSSQNKSRSTDSFDNTVGIDEIFTLVQKLYDLPINGRLIEEQVRRMKEGQVYAARSDEQFVDLPL
ncbi:unnamed protein product, partial [Rotaria sp. Silwood1]